MSETPFHLTVMGRDFYDGTMPRIAADLKRIATALERQAPLDGDRTDPTHWVGDLHPTCTRAGLIEEAGALKSEHSENLEYDRALAELVYSACGGSSIDAVRDEIQLAKDRLDAKLATHAKNRRA